MCGVGGRGCVCLCELQGKDLPKSFGEYMVRKIIVFSDRIYSYLNVKSSFTVVSFICLLNFSIINSKSVKKFKCFLKEVLSMSSK